jgi:hypothetical protein
MDTRFDSDASEVKSCRGLVMLCQIKPRHVVRIQAVLAGVVRVENQKRNLSRLRVEVNAEQRVAVGCSVVRRIDKRRASRGRNSREAGGVSYVMPTG